MTPKENFAKVAPPYMKRFMNEFNLTVLDAAAVFGNAGYESKGLTDDQEDKPVVAGSRGGANWFQWTGPRRVALEAFSKSKGLDWDSDEAAYQFLVHELKTSEKATIPKLKAAKSLDTKTVSFEKSFERAGVKAYTGRKEWALFALHSYERWAASEPKVEAPTIETPKENNIVDMIWNNIVQAVLRHAGTGLGSFLLTLGVFNAGQVETIIGAATIILTVGWSMVDKHIINKKAK